MTPGLGPRRRILGVGVDVVEVARIARVRRGGTDVLAHVCGPEELPELDDEWWGACLWAGKEAVAKSLGTGLWQAGVDWLDIRLGRDGGVRLLRRAAEVAGDSEVGLTFAPLRGLVLAVAVRWARESAGERAPGASAGAPT